MNIKARLTPSVKIITLCIAALMLFASVAFGALYYGVYNISALAQHTRPVYKVLEFARIRSVEIRSTSASPPDVDLDWQGSGIQIYEMHCLKCHGAPGLSPDPFALGMMPPPSAIARVGRRRTEQEMYWVLENGIKMSGMPAWKYRLTENEIWTVVKLLKEIPFMTKEDYALLRAAANSTHTSDHTPDENAPITHMEKTQRFSGPVALQQYNCTSCHMIDGISSASYYVGPPLNNIVKRSFIAGILPMNRENLIRWIMDPAKHKANTLMPDLSVDRQHAEAMTEYLFDIAN